MAPESTESEGRSRIHVFDTGIGPVQVETTVDNKYDLASLVRERAMSLALSLRFSVSARSVDVNYSPAPRAIESAYLSNPILLEEG